MSDQIIQRIEEMGKKIIRDYFFSYPKFTNLNINNLGNRVDALEANITQLMSQVEQEEK
jgi:hypothetical protein